MGNRLSTAFCLSVLLLSLASTAQEVPKDVRIVGVSAAGSGCLPGSVQPVISPDNKDLSLLFDNFVSESGTNQAAEVDKKVCVINMRLSLPPGWSMALVSSDYRGFAGIEAGGIAQHEALYSFNKNYAGSSFSSYTLRGPLNENYFYSHTLRSDLVNWSQCGLREVALTVRVSLVTQSPRINGQRPVSMLTLDSIDTSTRQSFSVAWRACGDNGGGGPRPGPIQPGPRPEPPAPRPGTYADVYQLWDGRDRYLTTDARLVERGSWVNQGIAFRLIPNSRALANLVPMYACLDLRINKHFVSSDSRCEGQRQERLLGFMSPYQQSNLVPLIEYVNLSDRSDRLFTTNAHEANGYQSVRTVGYVVRSR